MILYEITGTLQYLLRCPKAPGENCLPGFCPLHAYTQDVHLFVEAHDAERAAVVGLAKLSSAYPGPPLWHGSPSVVAVERVTPQRETVTLSRGDPLPGFDAFLGNGYGQH